MIPVDEGTLVMDERRRYPLVDGRGRVLGCLLRIREHTVVEADSPQHDDSVWPSPGDEDRVRALRPGEKVWAFHPHAMRNGSTFGAVPTRSWRHFLSFEEAKAYALAWATAAEKRARRR